MFCADLIDVITNFTVIMNVVIKRFTVVFFCIDISLRKQRRPNQHRVVRSLYWLCTGWICPHYVSSLKRFKRFFFCVWSVCKWYFENMGTQWMVNLSQHPSLNSLTTRDENTVNFRYLEDERTLRNTSRYPYFDISDLQNWGEYQSNNQISQMNM